MGLPTFLVFGHGAGQLTAHIFGSWAWGGAIDCPHFLVFGHGAGAMGLRPKSKKTPLKQSLRELRCAQKGGVSSPPFWPFNDVTERPNRGGNRRFWVREAAHLEK